MDNFLPFSSSHANSVQELSTDLNNNRSHFATHDRHLHTYSNVACPVNHSSQAFPQIPTGSERRRFLDPHLTKMARMNRKNAMIRSRNNSSPNSTSNEFLDSRRQVMLEKMKKNPLLVATKDLYGYSSFDNKKLRVLLVKHLKNSDVGSLGRIVLPKREAEGNLPELSDKEGITVKMRDANSMESWFFKYKFWSNNKSRMYVLENTGEFVKKNGVEMGDSLTVYEDGSKNLYFSIRKSEKQNGGRDDASTGVNYSGEMMFDEEEASIQMLIGNLNNDYPIPSDLMGLSIDQATSLSPPTIPGRPLGSSNGFVW